MVLPYIKHTLRLPDGVQFFYTDSGKPQSDDYITLVMQHGFNLHGGCFMHLHGLAREKNVRIIVLNRQGYPGSSDFSEAEMEELHKGSKRFLDHLALRNAWLLEHFVKDGSANKANAGGIALLGWSLGNAHVLSLLSDPAVVPTDVYNTIEPYLTSLVLYDPPVRAFGRTLPTTLGTYDPFNDLEYTTLEANCENFAHWCSSYFQHPDITNYIYDPSKRVDRRTVMDWTPGEWAERVDVEATAKVDLPMVASPIQPALRKQAESALFDEAVATIYFPKVKVLHFTMFHTSAECLWIWSEHQKRYDEAVDRGEKVRPREFKLLNEGNHMIHFDDPELFLDTVLDGVRGRWSAAEGNGAPAHS